MFYYVCITNKQTPVTMNSIQLFRGTDLIHTVTLVEACDIMATDRTLQAYCDSHLVFDCAYDHEMTPDDISDRMCANICED